MNSEKMLANLLEIKEFGNVSPLVAGVLDDLILSAKQDIATAEAKKTLGQNRYKAALAFAKYCAKEKYRPTLAGAFPMSGGRQSICDGFRAVIYDTPYDGLPEIEKQYHDNVMNMDNVFPNGKNRLTEVELPSLSELKTTFKIAKAAHTGKARDFSHISKVVASDGSHRWFNTKYLIEMIECVEPNAAYFMDEKPSAPMYLEGDGARGIVMAVRKEDHNEGEQSA